MKKYSLPEINAVIYKLEDVILSSSSSQIEKENYKKSFPHVLTNEDSSDEDKALDDIMFMDLMDD